MALITLICPHCGGDFELDPDRSLQPYWVCPYCGNRSLMQKNENSVRLRGIISGKTSQTSFGTPNQSQNGAGGTNGTAATAGSASATGTAGFSTNGGAEALTKPAQPVNGSAGAPVAAGTGRVVDFGRPSQAPTRSPELAAFLAGTPIAAAEPKRSLADIIAEAIAEPANEKTNASGVAQGGAASAVIEPSPNVENPAEPMITPEEPASVEPTSATESPVLPEVPIVPHSGATPPLTIEEVMQPSTARDTEPAVSRSAAPSTEQPSENAQNPNATKAPPQSAASAQPAADSVRPVDASRLPRNGNSNAPELEVLCQLAEAAAKRHDMPLFNSYSRRAIDLEPTDPRMYAWRALLIEEAGGFARSTWTTPLWQLQAPSRKMALIAQHFYNLSTSLRFCQETRRPELIHRIASLIVKQVVDHFHEQAVLRCKQNLIFKTFKGHYRRVDLRSASNFVDACRSITPEAFPLGQSELLDALRGEIRLLPKKVARRLNRF
jgi:hypothetical protein